MKNINEILIDEAWTYLNALPRYVQDVIWLRLGERFRGELKPQIRKLKAMMGEIEIGPEDSPEEVQELMRCFNGEYFVMPIEPFDIQWAPSGKVK